MEWLLSRFLCRCYVVSIGCYGVVKDVVVTRVLISKLFQNPKEDNLFYIDTSYTFCNFKKKHVLTISGSSAPPVFCESFHFKSNTTIHILGTQICMLSFLNLHVWIFQLLKEKFVLHQLFGHKKIAKMTNFAIFQIRAK